MAGSPCGQVFGYSGTTVSVSIAGNLSVTNRRGQVFWIVVYGCSRFYCGGSLDCARDGIVLVWFECGRGTPLPILSNVSTGIVNIKPCVHPPSLRHLDRSDSEAERSRGSENVTIVHEYFNHPPALFLTSFRPICRGVPRPPDTPNAVTPQDRKYNVRVRL